MLRRIAIIIFALCFNKAIRAEQDMTSHFVQLSISSSKSISITRNIPALLATNAPVDNIPSTPFRLQLASPLNACTELLNKPIYDLSTPTAMIVTRGGGCDFETKWKVVSQIPGISWIIVVNTISGMKEAGGMLPTDCTIKEESSSPEAWTNSGACAAICPTGICASDKAADNHHHSQNPSTTYCCLLEQYVQMKGSGKSVLRGAFVNIVDGEWLMSTVSTESMSLSMAMASTSQSPWNVSMIFIWLFGVSVVMGSAMYSARRDRAFSLQNYGVLAQDISPTSSYQSLDDEQLQQQNLLNHDDEEDPTVSLNAWHALGFVVASSSMLLFIYYGHVLVVINVVFAIVGVLSFAQVVTTPVMTKVASRYNLFEGSTTGCIPWPIIASFLPAAALGIYWFVNRMSSGPVWILQDIFGVCLCLVFLDTIHIPNLRVGTFILSAAFCYDVFFVYISPYVFGTNVMVAVASGGANVKIHGHDHCTLYPESPECGHDTMPLVIRIPLMFSRYGGEAMLGLGDIVLPGLLVSFALRFDYGKGYPISKRYFIAASISYAVGLLLANVMAVLLRNFVAGQPALMYIVPCALLTMIAVGKTRNEFDELWNGPYCIQRCASASVPEKEPFLHAS